MEHEAVLKERVRLSEMARLPYWNPAQMLVIDTMHFIPEGLVHRNCRHIPQIDVEAATRPEKPPAFDYDFVYEEDEDQLTFVLKIVYLVSFLYQNVTIVVI